MPVTRLPRMFLSSWVDNRRPQQRPRFNYGHGLGRDLRNAGDNISDWGFLANDRSLWHAITQQRNLHCNTNGGGYIWVDPEQLEQAAAERTLPPPLSYAGVLLGLLPLPDAPTPVVPSTPPASKAQTNKTSDVIPNDPFNHPIPITFITNHSPKACTTAMQQVELERL